MSPAHFSIVRLPSFGEGDFMDTVAQIPRCRSAGVRTHQGPPIQSHSGLWTGHVPPVNTLETTAKGRSVAFN